MDVVAIFAIIEKAMAVITTGISIGQNVLPAIQVVENLLTKQKEDSVTDADLTAAEATLDGMITDFNQPIA